ncbi:diacylglycerol kinase family protein [Blastococcus sp. CT_GayMR16]|uniref:diacylglycerol/lipid kinase family protein n=1 Tax=Blastococcus sp. CT_GayMR16 TaxID=2559607 RepID=UPI0010732AE6|nr:diacylglycerol kinase family protein [Blastococcus sp. CT_GayMR16]TFV88901.1 diacylglycerol kinase [Blastococcus sp. CT_GayMR16]
MGARRTSRSRAAVRSTRFRRTTGRRTAAVLALAAAVWTATLLVTVALDDFPRGLLVLVCGLVVAGGAWEGVLRRGWGRVAGLAVAGAALLGFGILLVDDGFLRDLLLLGIGVLIWHAGARLAFRPEVVLPTADPPRRPVLFINPRSDDGKAARVGLAAEARDRGIEPVELRPGDDLAALVRTAVADGADAVAMAGGDGSQAVAADVAARCDVPYACIPSGTRNHFALDLGVDRDDVVGALDAFVDGGERRVDLGEVNGRVFVNNVSLGVYAQAVQRTAYRQAKVRTLLATVPDALGSPGESELTWTTPGGRELRGAAVILVGNNQYRLGGAAGAGTRPAVDQSVLGITVLDPPSSRGHRRRRPWRQWSTAEFRVTAPEPIPVGIDGEAAVLSSPVLFLIRPAVLRVRIAAHHPGASPSAIEPVGAFAALRALARIAAGRDPRRPLAPARERVDAGEVHG